LGITEWAIILIGSLSAFIVPTLDKKIKNSYGKYTKNKAILKKIKDQK
jgi:hypothetical protein